MNEEIDESEFYHQDFTTASDWEIFVSRIEEIVNQWKLDESRDINKDGQSIWITKSEKLMFADTEFEFLYYKKINGLDGCLSKEPSKWKYTKIENSVDLGYDFQYFDRNISNTHSNLYIWYGLTEYFVLSPSGKEGITSESKIKVLLSSLHLVVNSLKCKIPFFVQIQEKWQNCYLGVLETFDESVQIRTNFEMIHLGWVPKWCQHLSSLLKLFTSKIMSPEELGYIYSSVQYTFHLSDFGNYLWQQDIFSLRSDLLDIMPSFELPFGVTVDPINLLHLKTTWLDVPSFNVYDNESSSSFKPELSHQWSILVQMYDQTVCILSDCLLDYLSLLDNNSRVFDIILEYSPIDALVESKVTNIPSILSKAARSSISGSRKEGSVISEEVLVSILYYLFPDAEQHEPKSPYHLMNENQQNDSNDSPQKATIQDLDKQCKGFKTCPHDSLLWRFAVISARLQHTGGGFRAFAQLWYEFVQEMRYRWDKNIIISGLINGFPDLRTCLLNQKLQMLNCCIERKKAREEHQRDVFEYESAEGSSTDDEFFDCADKSDEEMKKVHPVGRLSKFQNLKLIETGEPLYIPKTQEPVPKTEDQLDEDADVLLKLGTDALGSEMRAKLMSASLLSDMESFKAANPGAILEDFVRWYSPRDWEETKGKDQWGQKKGTLSTRMQIENNIWAQMWKSAKTVPANKQKLLFVDSKEAEKVLHFLESRTISQVCELLLPILLQAAIYRLATEAAKLDVELDNGSAKLQNLIKTSECISRERKLPARRVETIVQEMAPIEFDISTVNSLKYKLNPSGKEYDGFAESLSKLVKGKEVKIEKESEIGKQILTLFSDAQNNANLVKEEYNKEVKSVLNSPKVREYVMRIDAVRPAIYSAISPQFLRVIITKDDIRMAGAFSEDIGFF